MLSNTIAPEHYAWFRNQVILGKIPVNDEISMEMNRIDRLIRDPKYYYSPDRFEGWVQFCENELTLADGSDFHMLDSFKLWGEELWGWFYYVDRKIWDPSQNRRVDREILRSLITKQYLIVGRGAAKTMYDFCVQAYGLVIDPETTEQVTTAPTMAQADEVLSPFRTSIVRARGPVFQMMTQGSLQNTTGDPLNRKKLASTKKGIQNFVTNSTLMVKPMSIDKLQGYRNKYVTIDEWLSGDTRENPITAMEASASKGNVENFKIVVTSSEGTVRNGVGDDIKMELMSILRGEYEDVHSSIWYYRLDDVNEINNPALWVKANPNIGFTVSYETYELDVKKAEKVPSVRNEILAKRFGIPCEGSTYFFTYEETELTGHNTSYWNLPCCLGADLSQGGDFCAFTFLFPLNNGTFGIKTLNYISEFTYEKLPPALREKYDQFIKEGTLVVMPGTILLVPDIVTNLDKYIEANKYQVLSLGYDPSPGDMVKEFLEQWISLWGPSDLNKVPQTRQYETVPLTELKKLAEGRKLIFDQQMMKYTMGNCIVEVDTNGNKHLLKRKYSEKIDAVSALMDAFVAYKLNMDAF